MSNLSILGRFIIVLFILGGAGLIAHMLIQNPKKTETKDEKKSPVVSVRTDVVNLGTYPVEIEVLGQVIPARETILKAQVGGEVISVSEEFVPGGFFEKGAEILTVNPADYELDVRMRRAMVAQMEASLKIEKGQQATAKDELNILQQSTGKKFKSTDLALRKPQMAQAQADLDSVKAELAQSELNLARTTLIAPYNALLTMRDTNLGNIVSTQDTLGTLVSTDEYWVEIDVPLADIGWLKIPGSLAKIKLDGGRGERAGTLLKMTGTLNAQSRLASMIVSVPDPLHGTPLILGDYVKVILAGKTLADSVRVPQSYIRGNGMVWLERDGKLVIQTVRVVHKDRVYTYITEGLQDGDRIITSNIVTPVDGMDIQRLDDTIEETDG